MLLQWPKSFWRVFEEISGLAYTPFLALVLHNMNTERVVSHYNNMKSSARSSPLPETIKTTIMRISLNGKGTTFRFGPRLACKCDSCKCTACKRHSNQFDKYSCKQSVCCKCRSVMCVKEKKICLWEELNQNYTLLFKRGVFVLRAGPCTGPFAHLLTTEKSLKNALNVLLLICRIISECK